ncbi:aspartate/glutamate racemase family protein [uncultured Amnibacterium sp.]|uniref:aspartate/glutamate racemase family protein n=1 Tax=uncultured Amnibacterium sp. TaxID=1631851 RepID=UPI0035CA9F70
MRILVVNPNTTASMTATIGACAARVTDAEVVAVNPSMGPASIESHYDEALAVPGLLAEIGRGERDGAQGTVVACFGDPGLDAAREIAIGPVVGIAEAAMHVATLLGRTFAVVTTLSRTIGTAHDLVSRYGFTDRCVAIRACDIPVLDLELPGSDARRVVTELCREVVERDGADVVVLGCAGMADFCAEVSATIGVPVVDGVAAAVKLVESLIALGLTTSRRDEYAPPPAKPYSGPLQPFERRVGPVPVGSI